MKQSIATLLVKILEKAGIQQIWGITGDSLNGFNDSLNRLNSIKWIGTRHEEVAAFAAGAQAEITNQLSVCVGSCGPGNLHLINGLFDCHRNQVPVLAIAAHIPSSEIGSNYFQETHPDQLFKECSHYCELITNPDQLPQMLYIAMRNAILKRGVSVLVLPGDIALCPAPIDARITWKTPEPPCILPTNNELDHLVNLVNQGKRVTLLCGKGCINARSQVLKLAQKLQAPIVYSLRGKEHLEWDNPFSVGMTGFIGFSSGYHTMMNTEILIVLGSQFPYRQFYPSDASIIQIDTNPNHLGAHCTVDLALVGDIKCTLEALLPKLSQSNDSRFLSKALSHYKKARSELNKLAVENDKLPIHPQYLTKKLSDIAAEEAIFTCDVGTPTAWAARYLAMNGKRRLLGSFNHGSMANALAQAIGAQSVDRSRQVVALCGDGGFSMLMGDLLSLKQHNLPVKIIIINNSQLGFVAMEMKSEGYLSKGTELCNPSFAAIANAADIKGIKVEKSSELSKALQEALAHDGPALVEVITAQQELIMPPKIKLQQAKGFTTYMLRSIIDGRGGEVQDLVKQNWFR